MNNLALYSGLLAGGLGTGYNLIQGDSLPSALAQGAILGSTVGGGMYAGTKLSDKFIDIPNINKLLDDINIEEIELPEYITTETSDNLSKHFYRITTDLWKKIDDNTATPEEIDLFNTARKYVSELQNKIGNQAINNNNLRNSIYEHNTKIKAINLDNNFSRDSILDNLDHMNTTNKALGIGTGTGVGFVGGAFVNDALFQDKAEREKEQLLEELALLKVNGTISPFLDDYLVRYQ